MVAVTGSVRDRGADGAVAVGGGTSRGRVDLAIDLGVAAALIGLALTLRWPALDPSSLWLDDAWVALVDRTSGWQELRSVGFAAPGFAALLQGWFAVVGFSELTAQLPALVAGVLTPAAAYLVACWRGWHRAGALVAGVVLAVGPVTVTYATRVKQYTLEGLLGVVLLALALWLLDDRTDPRRWAIFVGAGAVGTVVSAFLAPTVAAGLAAAMVASLVERDRAGARWAAGWGVLYGAGALAWYLVVLAPAVTSSISGFWADDFLVVGEGPGALLGSLGTAWAGVLRGFLPLGEAGVPVVLATGVLVLAGVALALAGGGVAGGPDRGHRGPVLAVLLLTPSLVAVGLAALQLAPLGGGRTDLYLYPSLALLLAAGTDVVLRWTQRWRQLAIGASVAVLGVAVSLVLVAEPVAGYPRYDVRPLVGTMEAEAGSDDALLIYPATVWAYALYTSTDIHLEPDPVSSWGFYPRFADPRVVVLPPGRDDPDAYRPTVAALGAETDAEVVWLLASHWREDIEDLGAQLEAVGFSGTEVERRDGARLVRWERRDG